MSYLDPVIKRYGLPGPLMESIQELLQKHQVGKFNTTIDSRFSVCGSQTECKITYTGSHTSLPWAPVMVGLVIGYNWGFDGLRGRLAVDFYTGEMALIIGSCNKDDAVYSYEHMLGHIDPYTYKDPDTFWSDCE